MFNNKINTNLNDDLNNFFNNLNLTKKRKIEEKKNALIYVRCSTPAQNDDNNQSLYTQIGTCIEYCKQNNFNILNIFEDIHHGHDISKLKINNIINNIQLNDCHIIMTDPSRLSRNIQNTMNFIDKCEKKNITLHFTRDNLISDSFQDIKKIINLTYDAYIETQTLSKRLKTTFAVKKRNGAILGRVPFGFETYFEINNMLKIRKFKQNEAEQDIIMLINMLYFGINDMTNFYRIFQKITNKSDFILYDNSNNQFNQIYYRNFTMATIVNFLNEYNILNRTKLWNVHSLNTILNKSENFKVNHFKK